MAAAQAAKFMEEMEGFEGGRWVPYFALCLLPAFVPACQTGKSPAKPEDVNLETDIISISSEVSKVREPRRSPSTRTWRLGFERIPSMRFA